MTDLMAALGSALLAWLVARLFIFRQRAPGTILSRLGPSQSTAESPDRKPWLAGISDRFARSAPGARLASYAAINHPTAAFSDVLAILAASVLGGAVLGAVIMPGGPLALLAALAAPLAVNRAFLRRGGRRTLRIEQQLPDALHLQGSALRAGHSLLNSLQVVALEAKAPLGEELGRTVGEIELGGPLQESLEQLSARTASRDVELWVTAMLVHRITGGNLAQVVDSLARRIRDRMHLKGEVKALTAQARMSGVVVAMAPIAFFLLLSVTSREQMQVIYETPAGWMLLAAGLSMEAAGYLWIRWILRVKA